MGSEGSLPHLQEPATCLYPEPDRSSFPFPLSRSYRRISLIPRLLWVFRKMVNFLLWRVVSTSSKAQAGGPPLVGCPWLLIQYICSYPLYLEAVPPFVTWAMPVLTGTHLSRISSVSFQKNYLALASEGEILPITGVITSKSVVLSEPVSFLVTITVTFLLLSVT